MQLRFAPHTLHLRHAFGLATGSRTTTPIVLSAIEHDGVIGYGEASMPPYLGESHASVLGFLSAVDLGQFHDPFALEDILRYVDEIAPGHTAAKAAVDIALHDLVGKLLGQPWHRLWGLNPANIPPTSFTIGIDTPEVVRRKTLEAQAFRVLKLKLSNEHHHDVVAAVRSVTQVPFAVDVNGGWDDRSVALERIHELHAQGCVLIEQPLPRSRRDDLAWLTERSPLPIVGDEGIPRLADLRMAAGVYSGVNIKLMKCTGMREALKMVHAARALGLLVMLGCMTETSCAISAAAQLSPLVDWADLDGALLIRDDRFDGVRILDGLIELDDTPGIGAHPRPSVQLRGLSPSQATSPASTSPE